MQNEFFRNRIVQIILRLITAVSFTLFTFYQIILSFQIETSRFGRLVGIVFYLLLTVAAFLDFSETDKAWAAHSVLLVVGLILLFAFRMLNIPTVFGNLNFSFFPSVLNAAAFILSQLGTLCIVVGNLVTRSELTDSQKMKLSVIFMIIAIALYALCLASECVMMIKYRFNVDLSLRFTLLSRLWYFLGFAGTAFCFMLPAPKTKREHKSGHFVYSDEEDGSDEIDLVI